MADALVGPTLSVGMSEHHMRFPGSITLRPITLVSVVRDVIMSLARHGFRRIFFINGHGGNTASIDAGFFEAYAEAPQILDRQRGSSLHQYGMVAHGGRRTSQHRALRRQGRRPRLPFRGFRGSRRLPRSPQNADLAPEPPPSTHVFGPADFRRRYPEGRMGSYPALASVEAGQRIIEAVAADLAKEYRTFLDEE